MYKIFIHFLSSLEKILFPGLCSVCHHPGPSLCPACRSKIKPIAVNCPLCGLVNSGLICASCSPESTLSFDGLIALDHYESSGLKPAINALKFQGAQEIGYSLGRMLGRRLVSAWRKIATESEPIIIPVPLHPRRQRERGYNQAEKISEGIRVISGWQIHLGLKRLKYGKPSAKLNYRDRQAQLKVFSYNGPSLKGKTIILVDDIFTTGSTAEAAAHAVKEGGAKTVIVAVLALVS